MTFRKNMHDGIKISELEENAEYLNDKGLISRKRKSENLSRRININAIATTMGLISIKNLIIIILKITTEIRNVDTKVNLFFIISNSNREFLIVSRFSDI